MNSQRGSRDIALLFLWPRRKGGGGWSTSRPGRFTPRKSDPVPLVQEAGWTHCRYWRGRKISAPPQSGFDPRTAQPVASRYTDWAIWTLCRIKQFSLVRFELITLHVQRLFLYLLTVLVIVRQHVNTQPCNWIELNTTSCCRLLWWCRLRATVNELRALNM